MKTIIRTYKFKVKASKSTKAALDENLSLCRELYNLALEQRILIYKQRKEYYSGFSQVKELIQLKQAFPEFKKVYSQTLQTVILALDTSFQNFYRGRKKNRNVGFPRFKSENRFRSLLYSQSGFKLVDNTLTLSKIGEFKLLGFRPLKGKLKRVSIKKSLTNDIYVSLVVEQEIDIPTILKPREVGLDLGLEKLITDSSGSYIKNPRYLRKASKKLAAKQRSLSRKKRGSKRREKALHELRKVYEKLKNTRKDYLHKVSRYYVRNYDSIFVEDIDIISLTKKQTRLLRRSTGDASWSAFIQMLTYKAEEAGKLVQKIDPRNTSKTCSCCGSIKQLSLNDRIYECLNCGLVIDRDYNASLNILKRGGSTPPQVLTTKLTPVVVA